MRLCSSKIFLIATMVVLLFVVFGCSQKDDVVKPQDKASLTLRPQYLPELEDIYTYEFWAFSVSGADTTFTSLGKFLWDNALYRFRNVDGSVRDSVFELPEAYNLYDYFAITIENASDPSPTVPSGVFIMIDEVVDPATRPVELKYPVDMSATSGSYFVGTPTDDTVNTANENKGVWLCSQVVTSRFNHDTLGVDSFSVQLSGAPDDPDSLVPDTIGIVMQSYWDTTYTNVIFGLDTIPHRQITIEYLDTVDPDNNYILFVDYDIDSGWTDDAIPVHENLSLGQVLFYTYQNTFGETLPSIEEYGWQYNAWVFHEYFDEQIPVGIPFGYGLQGDIASEPDWRVVQLGAFQKPDTADFSNLYGDNREVPNFPGEDFILNLPAGYNSFDFTSPGIPDTSGFDWGVVVVGMEPMPSKVTINPEVNFPLFFLSKKLSTPGDYSFVNYHTLMPSIAIEVDFHE